MKHDTPAVGMFIVSDDPECWPAGPAFDTREECLAHAKAEIDFPVWVGRVSIVVDEALVADILIRNDNEAEEIITDAHDVYSEEPLLDITGEDRREMLDAVAAILRDRKCVTHWYQVEDVERTETWEDIKP